jgi:hypothetical protein
MCKNKIKVLQDISVCFDDNNLDGNDELKKENLEIEKLEIKKK